jgi:WXXGXW repeat (2 copies)
MRQPSNSILVLSACALALGMLTSTFPGHALAQISVSISLAPPALPVEAQPVLAEDGGIWAPGYWAYDQEVGYFWVPGTWMQPPEVGLLWTPGYWAWGNGGYLWNDGYWSPTVGFYGGIAYGFGYSGRGYTGGHWQGQHFYYNTAVSQVNVTNIHNTYSQTVVNNTRDSRVSFNGGAHGVTARPTAAEQAATRAPHQAATALQMQHRQAAIGDHVPSAAVSHDKPQLAAKSEPTEPSGHGAVKASAAGPAEITSKTVVAAPVAKRTPAHAADLPPVGRQTAPSTGNAARDEANQQEQESLRASQEKQRQALQQQQAADHERAAKPPSTSASVKQLEQQHQAQTEALAQRHTVEQKTLQETQDKRPQEKGPAGPHS